MNFSDENLNTTQSSATEPLDQFSFNVKVRVEGNENNNFWSPSFTDLIKIDSLCYDKIFNG